MADRLWTVAEIERAVSMRRSGVPRAEIAHRLNRSEDAIRSVLNRRGVKLADSASWSEEEDALILGRGDQTWEQVSQAVSGLGRARSPSACRSRRRALDGLRSRAPAKKRKLTGDEALVRAVLKGWAELQGVKVAA